jgi:hypothetical protein
VSVGVGVSAHAEPARRAVACRCGARFTACEYAALAAVRILEESEIAPLVVQWPVGTVVEVRSCSSCASAIARLVRRRSAMPLGGAGEI